MNEEKNPATEPEEEGLIIEFSAPANFGICYLEAAMKVGMEELQRSKRFIDIAGNLDAGAYMEEAEESMKVLLGCVAQAKQQVYMALQSRSSQWPGEGAGDEDEDEEAGGPSVFNSAFAKPDKAGSGEDDEEEGKSPLEN